MRLLDKTGWNGTIIPHAQANFRCTLLLGGPFGRRCLVHRGLNFDGGPSAQEDLPWFIHKGRVTILVHEADEAQMRNLSIVSEN